MSFDTEMDRRLINWARWTHMRGSVPGAGAMESRVDGAGWDAPTVIPLLDAEAEETGKGVQTLENALRYAVSVWYLSSGGVAKRAAQCACSETELRRRIERGQRALGQWLQSKREAAELERTRVERLHAARIL